MDLNVTYSLEQIRSGFRAQLNANIAYKKLKCFKEDVHHQFYLDPAAPEPCTPIFACHFSPIRGYEHWVALANEDGRIALMETKGKKIDESTFMSIQGHNNAIFDLIWANRDAKLISASGDHTACLWDIGGAEIKKVLNFQGHTRSVKTISCKPNDQYSFATGARDGMINIWDFRTNNGTNVIKPENTISLCHYPCPSHNSPKYRRTSQFRADSITGLAFQDENTLISCSAGDGTIKVWDLRKSYSIYKRQPQPRHVLSHIGKTMRKGFTCLAISPCGLKLFANCIDSTIYCYNIGTYNKDPIASYKGHLTSSFYIKHTISSDGKYIASGSSDDKAYVWSVSRPEKPIISLNGHTAEVTCVDWCLKGEIKMATCSDDGSYRTWRLHPKDCSNQDPDLKGTAVEHESLCESDVTSCKRKKAKSILPIKKMHLDVGPSFQSEVNDENALLTSPNSGTMCAKRPRICDSAENEVFSPTSGLPNYVLDGTSPHSHRCTPVTKPSTTDWLTRLREITPNREQSMTTRRRLAKDKMLAKGNLLKFFKVAGKQSVTCDHIGQEATGGFIFNDGVSYLPSN